MVLGFLTSMLAGPLAKAGGWVLDKVGSLAKWAGNKVLGNETTQKVAQAIGPTITKGFGEDSFNQNMRKFGTTIEQKVANTGLKPVINGQSVGDAFYKGMTSIYNYMKNGGQSTDAPTDMNGQPTQGVEKQQQQQQNQNSAGDQVMSSN